MFNEIQVPSASKQKLWYVSFEYIVTGEVNIRVEEKVALVLEKGSCRNAKEKRGGGGVF